MKKMLLSLIALLSINAQAWDVPEVLESACTSKCTPKMEQLYSEFLSTPNPLTFYPGMYSGECNHLSSSFDPNTTHYAGMLFNTDAEGAYMTGNLQFFGDSNGMANYSYEDAKRIYLPTWKGGGRLKFNATSTTTYFTGKDDVPALIYWARQNLETKDILFLIYMKDFSIAFCRLKPNPNGFPQ